MRSMVAGAVCAAGVLMAVCAAPGKGQGLILPRRPVPIHTFSVRSLRVSADIHDAVAQTRVEQTFANDGPVDLEGEYLFPLPEGGAVSAMSLRTGDRVIEGKVLPRDEARSLYERIVLQRKDPGLLEWVGHGLFRSGVFPVPAHGQCALTLTYTQVLPLRGGMSLYTYPLATGRFSGHASASMSVLVRLRTGSSLSAVYSPSHDVSVRRTGEQEATASWESVERYPERDFDLYFSAQKGPLGVSTVTYHSGPGDGYFAVVMAPPVSASSEPVARDIVYVLDRTGSMAAADKMKQAREAVNYCLNRLGKSDRFGLIAFNETADALSGGLQPASPHELSRAHQFVDRLEPEGGTNIGDALDAALALLRSSQRRMRQVVFITDGLPTVGETSTEVLLSRAAQATGRQAGAPGIRIFSYGVGYDVNAAFLDRLSADNGGDSDYVRPNEQIERLLAGFADKTLYPAITDVKMDFEGGHVYDVYPQKIPDLFRGGQLVVVGRFRDGVSARLRVSGHSGDTNLDATVPTPFSGEESTSVLVPRLWAMRKIGYLIDQIRLTGSREVVDEIIRLSRDFGIMTPYTSFLADDTQAVAAHWRGGGYARDNEAARSAEELARRDLGMLGGAASSGLDAVSASLNSQGYRMAERAPTGMQGGFGGGGGRDAVRKAMSQRGRAGISADLADASSQVASGSRQGPGYRQMTEVAQVQAVGDRVFYRQGGVWFDRLYKDGMPVTRVKSASEAQVAVLRRHSGLARYVNVGAEVVIVVGRRAVQFGADGAESLTAAELDGF